MQIPRYWRLNQQLYGLVGEVCESCGEKLFPPRDVCPVCRQPASKPFTFSGRGRVYSYSIVRQAPEGFEEYPETPGGGRGGVDPLRVQVSEAHEGPGGIARGRHGGDLSAGHAFVRL